jgi:hypothetical protein
MADGTLRGLRAGIAQTYWDANKTMPYAQARPLCYNALGEEWRLGPLVLQEDFQETTATKLVLRVDLSDGSAVKIILPQAEGALTAAAIERGSTSAQSSALSTRALRARWSTAVRFLSSRRAYERWRFT